MFSKEYLFPILTDWYLHKFKSSTYLEAWNWEDSRNDIDLNGSSIHLGQKINGKMKSNLFADFYNNWIRVDCNVQVVKMGFGDIWVTDLNHDGRSHSKAAKGYKKELHDAGFKGRVDYCERVSEVNLLNVEC